MTDVILVPKVQHKISLEAEVIKPDEFAGKTIEEIKELPVYFGNTVQKLGDFFEVSGSAEENAENLRIVVEGDVSRVKRIGEGMTTGEILVKGDVDMYLGARMKGGRIVVEGSVDSFAGQQMRGGEIEIKGNAKDYLGGSYRGDWRGMRGGRIIVEGNAGKEVAEFMRGGEIIIKGNCDSFAGVHMKKGLVIIEGSVAERVGAEMVGGSIIVLGEMANLLPSFKIGEVVEGLKIDGREFPGKFRKYIGDFAEGPSVKGVIYKRL